MSTPSGIPADSSGGPTIDPTKNVLDLVRAESRYQDSMREQESKFQNAMRDAETRRVNELASQKQVFDLELARLIRLGTEEKSTLLAMQLKEVKSDLSERTAKMEQFRWETGGKDTGRDKFIAWIVAALAVAAFIITNYPRS